MDSVDRHGASVNVNGSTKCNCGKKVKLRYAGGSAQLASNAGWLPVFVSCDVVLSYKYATVHSHCLTCIACRPFATKCDWVTNSSAIRGATFVLPNGEAHTRTRID